MNTARINSLLATLSNIEYKWFERYIRSEYFNRNAQVVAVFELLGEDRKLPGAAEMQRVLFGDGAGSAQKVYDLTSFFFRHLEDFLALRQQSDESKQLLLLEALRTRRQHKQFQRKAGSLAKRLQANPLRNDAHHLHSYLLETEADLHHIQQETRSTNDRLQQVVTELDLFYLSAKLKHTCEMLSRMNVVNTSYQISLVEPLVEHIRTHWPTYRDQPAVAVYYFVYLALSQPDEEQHFADLLAHLQQYRNAFPEAEARELYNYARNYCILKINRGQTRYLAELVDLYKQLAATGLLYDGKYLTQWDYKNAITAGLRSGERDWAYSFIYEQKPLLDPQFRENAFNYNLSNFLYETGEMRKARRLLQSVEFTDVYYGLSARALLLKIYFEEDDSEALFALCSAFSTYLKRSKLASEYQKRVQRNLIRFVKKAYQLKLNRPGRITPAYRQKVETLQQEIEATAEISNMNWLQSKVAGLIE